MFGSTARRAAWIAGLLAQTLAVACAGQAPTPAISDPHSDLETDRAGESKVLMMHFMPWFQTPGVSGRWGEHWTGWEKQHNPESLTESGQPDIYANYHPLIGLYDSSDSAVIECQLLQMRLAGIDGVIVDWYGLAETADYAAIHRATGALFAQTERFGMRFAVTFEDRTFEYQIQNDELEPSGVVGQLADTLTWLDQNWFASPNYLRVGGRPMLMVFGPMFVKDAAQWADAFETAGVRPALFGLHHLWKGVGGDGGFTWVHAKPWEGDAKPESVRAGLVHEFGYTSKEPEQIIVSAFPGFDDVYAQSLMELDHRDGETLRESLSAGMLGDWPIIQLVTWNDYGEGTMIEPTHEFGYTFLEVVQEARRDEIGESFAPTPEDLRLPARLLELRKAGRVDAAELDRIASLLNSGSCDEARAVIERVGG